MNEAVAIFLLLIALDGPAEKGLPSVIARFGGSEPGAITADFVRCGPDAPLILEIDWFLDGDGLVAPVATSPFLPGRRLADSPHRISGSFLISLPEVEKPTQFRGIIRARGEAAPRQPLGDFLLVLYPREHFTKRWQKLAESRLAVAVLGEPGDWLTFLEGRGVPVRPVSEGDLAGLDSKTLLVANLAQPATLLEEELPRSALVYSDPTATGNFLRIRDGRELLWIQGPPPDNVANDPSAQNTFLELAERLITTPPPTP